MSAGALPAGAEGTAPSASALSGLAPASVPESTAPASAGRRLALFGAAAALLAPPIARPAAAQATVARQTSVALPHGPLTLAQAEALDFEALWRSLPAGVQARIGALVLRNEMMLQLVEDGGFHTTVDDREDAQRYADGALDALRPAIWAALPAVMPTVYDEPYPLWQFWTAADIDAERLRRHPEMAEVLA